MYSTVLLVHSWLRWIVLALGLLAIVRGGRGRSGLPFTIALDIQFLVGLVLYTALSPMTRAAMQNMAGAMHAAAIRFWAVEHPAAMVLALVFAHLGRSRPRYATAFYAVALVLLLIGMPWPGLPYARPLLRLR